jgi:hypothetical protein
MLEEMKRCPKCMLILTLENFASRRGVSGGASYCKVCQNAYSTAHYRAHEQRHNRRRYANQKIYRNRNNKFLREYLVGHGCVDCGEADIRVLEFDHVRGKKLSSVAELCGKGVSWQRVVDEIAKCEVRCANCHRRKTVGERGWWRSVGT